MNKVLVIAPHPDDEILGCGGTIAKHTSQRDRVFLCIVTTTYPPRWSDKFRKNRLLEIKEANAALDIKKTYFLNLPTVKLNVLPHHQLADSISDVVKKTKPDILYIPHLGDLNKDHRLVFEASLVVARPYSQDHRIKKILSYETPSETEWGQPLTPFLPNTYVDITRTFKTKLAAMKSYKSELRPYPHPRSLKFLEILAKKRGAEVGFKLAEAFTLIREIK